MVAPKISNNYFPDTLRSLAFGGISGAYANVGAITAFCYDQLFFTNSTNGALIISFNGGTTDHLAIPAGWGFTLSPASGSVAGLNHPQTPPIGTQFAVKQADATVLNAGGIFIAGFYEK